MKKTVFKNEKGEIHFGVNAPEGFTSSINEQDIKKSLTQLGKNKLWRCIVCNDLHLGVTPPVDCPTCYSVEMYVQINKQEFKEVAGL